MSLLTPDAQRDLDTLLPALARALRARGQQLCCAESCTGGLIAAACTELAGSSDWFDRGFVTYSNAAKVELLGVPAALLEAHGAVSDPVARAMAEGALLRSAAHWSLAVTGIAGPGGGSADKPVGTVCLAWAHRASLSGEVTLRSERHVWPGDRQAVRSATLQCALGRLRGWVGELPGSM